MAAAGLVTAAVHKKMAQKLRFRLNLLELVANGVNLNNSPIRGRSHEHKRSLKSPRTALVR